MTSATTPSGLGWAIPVRLLSSVAVVGRDNEPIYLRGDLCDCISTPVSTPVSSPSKTASDVVPAVSEDDGDTDGTRDDDGGKDGEDEGASEESHSPTSQKRGLFRRIKGVMGKPTVGHEGGESSATKDDTEGGGETTDAADAPEDATDDEDDDSDDPFGFFGSSPGLDFPAQQQQSLSVGNNVGVPAPMSLTQQLVLHASLDRFEEMASRSNKGGAVRWRTPGSTGANAMWMGLLCEVEEKWTVYGYLTNTGIKFMILVENIFLNEDGTRQDESVQTFANSFPPSTNSSSKASNREGDLKVMFAKLHELYVRHTMNPFSKIRGAIKSRVFDKGIVEMATSFNKTAMDQAISSDDDVGRSRQGGSVTWM